MPRKKKLIRRGQLLSERLKAGDGGWASTSISVNQAVNYNNILSQMHQLFGVRSLCVILAVCLDRMAMRQSLLHTSQAYGCLLVPILRGSSHRHCNMQQNLYESVTLAFVCCRLLVKLLNVSKGRHNNESQYKLQQVTESLASQKRWVRTSVIMVRDEDDGSLRPVTELLHTTASITSIAFASLFKKWVDLGFLYLSSEIHSDEEKSHGGHSDLRWVIYRIMYSFSHKI